MSSKRDLVRTSLFSLIKSLGDGSKGFIWRTAKQNPITKLPSQPECPAFYLFDFQEIVEQRVSPNQGNAIRVKTIFMFEFWVSHTYSDTVSEKLNEILYLVQGALLGSNLNGLVQSLDEVGSKFKIDSEDQRIASCEFIFEATYVRTHLLPM